MEMQKDLLPSRASQQQEESDPVLLSLVVKEKIIRKAVGSGR